MSDIEGEKKLHSRELIRSFTTSINTEISKLESRIKQLEGENKQLKDILGIKVNVHEFESASLGFDSLKIKPQYLEISTKQHTIFETWISGEVRPTLLKAAGYKQFSTQCIQKAGTAKVWTHESILEGSLIYQQSKDHFHSVIQIAAYLIDMGFTNVVINHWNDVDVSGTYNGVTYAFEYERPKTHTSLQVRNKFISAKRLYDTVYIICSSENKDIVSIAVEGKRKQPKEQFFNMCTRGNQFEFFIGCIVAGKPIKNCPVTANIQSTW